MEVKAGFCPGVPLHKGITIVISLFRSHWLAVVYRSVLCIGSCEPVHEDRTKAGVTEPIELVCSHYKSRYRLPMHNNSQAGYKYSKVSKPVVSEQKYCRAGARLHYVHRHSQVKVVTSYIL